jgi:hypothetical protein
MRKYIFIFLLVFGPLVLFAQKKTDDTPVDKQIKGVVILGMNMSQVDGDEVYGFYKAGLNAGFGAILPLSKSFAFNIETLYNQKGAYKKYSVSGDSTGLPYYKVKLDYLEVPAYITFEDRHIWTIGLGFSWGRRINYKETIRGTNKTFGQYFIKDSLFWTLKDHIVEGDTTYKEYPLSKNDWSVLVSLQLRVWRHLKVDLRYSYSMASIGTRDYITQSGATWSRKLYNNVLTFRLLYLLNEKYTPPQKTKKKNKINATSYVAPWTL